MSEWYSRQSKANLAAHIVSQEAQLAQRDAALKAADDFATAADNMGSETAFDPDCACELCCAYGAARSAYRKARGQDA